MSFIKIIQECMEENNVSIEKQNFIIANCLKIEKQKKQEERKMLNSAMTKFEKNEKNKKRKN